MINEATRNLLARLERIKLRADWPGCEPHRPTYVDGCARCANVAGICGHQPASRTELIAAVRELQSVCSRVSR